MSFATVDDEWLPCDKTLNAIKKRYISKSQYVKVLKQFRKEKRNTIVENANTVFLKMFNGMYGEDSPAPDRSEDKAQAEARKQAFKSKSKDSKERIIDIKDNVQYQVGEEQLRANLTMIANRFGWTSEQCDKWLERELEKDSKRKAR